MAKTVLNINNYEKILADFDSYNDYKDVFLNIVFDNRLWKKARRVNTRIDYEDYLLKFPNGLHKDEAKNRIIQVNSEDNKAWEKAKAVNKQYSYESYIKDYPEGLNIQEAKIRLMDIIVEKNDWERTKGVDTKSAYEIYLNKYPNGLYKSEATKIVVEHETWEDAKISNTKNAYKNYLTTYLNGLYAAEAIARINEFIAEEERIRLIFWKVVNFGAVIIAIAVIISIMSGGESNNKSVSNQQPVNYNTPITPAPPVQPQTETLYVNTQQMILRAGAGSEYGEISKIPYGDAVIATETAISIDGGNWVKVKTGGYLEGWLNRKLLSTTQPVLNNLDTLSVTIGNQCYCANQLALFDVTYNGKPITISMSFNGNEAHPVNHPLVISQDGHITNDLSLPCQDSSENKCPAAGSVVQVMGNWTGTENFEVRQIDFPKAESNSKDSANTQEATLSAESYGEVVFGSSLADIAKKLGEKVPIGDMAAGGNPDSWFCDFVKFQHYPKVQFMVEKGIVTRADVEAGIPNVLGLSVGTSLIDVKRKYPSVQIEPNKYDTEGHDLIFKSADTKKAIVINESKGEITNIRAGIEPSVEYVEGCM